MSVFEPPPTYADPVLVDEKTGKSKFNPIWLKWFIDFTGVINASGGGSGAIQHNDTAGLQGGTANQYYHSTAAQNTFLAALAAAGTLGSGASVLGNALTAWTPTDASGAGLTLTLGTCNYFLYGKLCIAQFSITYPATADASATKIGGLPATSVSGDNVWPVIIGGTNFGSGFTGRVLASASSMVLETFSSVGITNAAFSGKGLRGAAVFATT